MTITIEKQAQVLQQPLLLDNVHLGFQKLHFYGFINFKFLSSLQSVSMSKLRVVTVVLCLCEI